MARACFCFGRKNRRGIDCRDHGDLATNQLGGQARQLAIVTFSQSVLNRDVLTVNVAAVSQASTILLHKVCSCAGGRGVKISNHRHRRLLRALRAATQPPNQLLHRNGAASKRCSVIALSDFGSATLTLGIRAVVLAGAEDLVISWHQLRRYCAPQVAGDIAPNHRARLRRLT
jgi:hypothetical protein